jgi:hypothetical protein
MRFRFRKPVPIVGHKLTPDPASAAELARRRAGISFRPSYGFIVDEVKKAGPRFDAPAPVVEATPEQVLELVQAPAQDPTAQQIVSEAPVARTPDAEPAAPAGIDWSKYDEPTCYRLGFPDPMRRSTAELLYPLPSLLRRQAG